jgi:PAS domain S-box-containing protein
MKQEDRYRHLLLELPAYISSFLPDGTITFVNNALANLTRRRSDELIGTCWFDLIKAEEREFVQYRLNSLTPQNPVESHEQSYVGTDGTLFRQQWTNRAVFDESGRLEEFLATGQDITDRKQAEQWSMQFCQNYETFFNTTNDYLFVLDSCGNIIFTNKTVLNRLGFSRDELLGHPMLLVHPLERRAEAASIMSEMLKGKLDFCPIPLRTKSGSLIPVETRVSWGLWDSHPAVFAVCQDISKTQLSEEKFSKLFYINPSACGLTDVATGKYLEVNEAFCKLFGFKKEEVIGNTPIELGIITPEGIQTVLGAARARGHMANIEADLRAKNGAIKQVLLSSEDIYVQDKKLRYTVVQDITDLKHIENALRESEEKYRAIFHESIVAIYVFNAQKRFINSNQAGLDLLGYSRAELLSMSIPDVDADPDAVQPAHQQLLSGGRLINYEHRLRRKDGTIITVSNNSKPLVDEQGNIIGMLSTLIDISERKADESLLEEQSKKIRAQNEELNRANMELHEAKKKAEEADRLKSAFLANMSHEIRTPMNGILGFAELLKEPNLSGGRMQSYIAMIEKSGARMLNIINDILDLAKIESGQVEVVESRANINEMVQYICDFFRPEANVKGIHLDHSVKLPSQRVVIRTDREKLYAILTNLVKNAIKYTDAGRIEIAVAAQPDHLEFCVKDTGIGIPRELYRVIFDRFMQADMTDKRAFQGAGLGLAITKAYVEMLGGTIWVESEHGHGSRFFFTVPCPASSEVEEFSLQATDRSEDIILGKRLKILIVEDDDISAKLLSTALAQVPGEVSRAVDGAEAVDFCRAHPEIDLILMDLKLPTMDGFEAVRRIRQFNPKVPIIAQTAYGLHGDREKALQAGCDNYIAKPIRRKELLALVEKYCG